ncbi:MAG: flagellar motor switch protein FliG [Rhizobiaceae bacterium]
MNTLPALTKPQKAAAILVAMGKPAAGKLLKFFKQHELKALIEGARLLKTIPQAELERIVAEFEAEFTEGVGLLDSSDKMDNLLTETLTQEEMDALMGKTVAVVVDEEAPPSIWPQIEALDPQRLGDFLAGEQPQTAAVVLSNLPPQAASRVLLTLTKEIRSEIIRRLMLTSKVPDAALKIIENQMRARLLVETSNKDNSAGQTRVASLLNELDKSQLDEVMGDLAEAGMPDLDAIRARLFAFEDIVLLTQKARVALFDGISTEVVTLALRNADAALIEAILSSIGARSRRMIEAELGQGSDGIANDDIVRARKSIASTAIRLANEGAFELPTTTPGVEQAA